MGHMLRDDWFTLGGWDLIVDIGTLDLGDGVAVLDLDWDQLDLGVIDTVLSDDLAASVLDGSLDRVSNGMSNGSDDWSSSKRGGMVSTNQVLRISLGLSFSLSLDNVTSSWGVTKEVGHLLADLLVLDLLGLNSLGAAHSLGGGGTGLGHKDLALNLAVRGGNSDSGGSVGNGNRGGNSGGGSVHGSYSGGSGQAEVGVAGGGQKGGVSLRVGGRGS